MVFMKNLSYYMLSLSGGKDSLTLFLKIIEQVKLGKMKLNEVVAVDLGDEFEAIYDVWLFVASICLKEKIKFTVLTIPETEEYKSFIDTKEHEIFFEIYGRNITMFEFLAFFHQKENGECGYRWCGKMRWGTAIKNQLLNNYYQSKEMFIIDYVGIAADETERMKFEPLKNICKAYPLVAWKMTEADCLKYCYEQGVFWMQDGIRLYDILDRVSCIHCQNKNLKELRNYRRYLPAAWEDMKRWQLFIKYCYRDNQTVFDLEKRFEAEDAGEKVFERGNKKYVQHSLFGGA